MKTTIGLLIFVISLFVSYFSCTIFWAFLAQMSYYDALIHPAQLAGFLLLYWWLPGMFILYDYSKVNNLDWF